MGDKWGHKIITGAPATSPRSGRYDKRERFGKAHR
jgi:hypothetical protein